MMSQLQPSGTTGCVALSNGEVYFGHGFGAEGVTVGEVCFNTSMTGYQEISTDPSYAHQIVTFTFPHIGNVGTTMEDEESAKPYARGMIVKWYPSEQSSWRATSNLSNWMSKHAMIGIGGVDTRRLTRAIRSGGAPHAAIAHQRNGKFDTDHLLTCAAQFLGIDGADLAKDVTCQSGYNWRGKRWQWPVGFTEANIQKFKVAAIDFGIKRNLLRCLTDSESAVRVFPAESSMAEILQFEPDGLFLSNGPGDPAATGDYSVPLVKDFIKHTDIPIFGICLGHQILALALGARTVKMSYGHHGANHPVKDLETGKVEITSMNHGFMVDRDSLPKGVMETHISLFDGTNCGIRMTNKPVFSVQFHPEASPGPQDSFYLFERFADAMRQRKALT